MKGFRLHELERLKMHHNAPIPECCPKCKGELRCGEGIVGEDVLHCPNEKCNEGIVWEDTESALAIII